MVEQRRREDAKFGSGQGFNLENRKAGKAPSSSCFPAFQIQSLRVLRVFASSLFLLPGFAEDKKPEEKKPEPPAVAVVLPLGIETGTAQKFTLDRRKIQLEEPIRSLGEFKVAIRLHHDVTAAVTVQVTREE